MRKALVGGVVVVVIAMVGAAFAYERGWGPFGGSTRDVSRARTGTAPDGRPWAIDVLRGSEILREQTRSATRLLPTCPTEISDTIRALELRDHPRYEVSFPAGCHPEVRGAIVAVDVRPPGGVWHVHEYERRNAHWVRIFP